VARESLLPKVSLANKNEILLAKWNKYEGVQEKNPMGNGGFVAASLLEMVD